MKPIDKKMEITMIYVYLIPIAWLGSLFLVVTLIYKWYKQSLNKTKQRKRPWFDPPPEKLVYEELVAKHSTTTTTLNEKESNNVSHPKVDPATNKLLASALVKLAIAYIKIINQMAQEKNSLHSLVKTGAIGEDMWENFQAGEQAMQMELHEVMEEADTFKPGWSKTIFQEAQQYYQQQMQKAAEQAQKLQLQQLEAFKKQREAIEAAEKEADRKRNLKELLHQEEREKSKATNGNSYNNEIKQRATRQSAKGKK